MRPSAPGKVAEAWGAEEAKPRTVAKTAAPMSLSRCRATCLEHPADAVSIGPFTRRGLVRRRYPGRRSSAKRPTDEDICDPVVIPGHQVCRVRGKDDVVTV